jgi:hypothetical protein
MSLSVNFPCSLQLRAFWTRQFSPTVYNVLAQNTNKCLIILTSGRGLCTITWFSAKSTSHACSCTRPKGTVRGLSLANLSEGNTADVVFCSGRPISFLSTGDGCLVTSVTGRSHSTHFLVFRVFWTMDIFFREVSVSNLNKGVLSSYVPTDFYNKSLIRIGP